MNSNTASEVAGYLVLERLDLVATLLLEHLVSLARAAGVQTFTAEVLADNYSVLRLLSDSGLVLRRRIGNGVVYAVSPHAGDIEGIACVPSVAALPRRPTWRWWRRRRPRWQGWPVFGSVLVVGLGGIATGVLAGHAARLAPLTGADAEDLLRAIRAAPTLLEQALDTGGAARHPPSRLPARRRPAVGRRD